MHDGQSKGSIKKSGGFINFTGLGGIYIIGLGGWTPSVQIGVQIH